MSIKAYSSYTIIDVVDGMQWQNDATSHPTNPKEGWAYYNTADKKSYLYDGEKWVILTRDGFDGDGISEEISQYCQSSLYSTAPTSGWSDVFPDRWDNDKPYIWCRTKQVWNRKDEDGALVTKYTAPQLMSQLEVATIMAQKENLTLDEWCVDKSVTVISGSQIATGTITANQINIESLTAHNDFKVAISNEIDNVEIGGRNLYTCTSNFSGNKWLNLSVWAKDENVDAFGNDIMYKNGQWGGIHQRVPAKSGDIFTLSATVFGDGNCWAHFYASEFNDDGNELVGSQVKNYEPASLSSTGTRIYATYTVINNCNLSFRIENSAPGAKIKISSLKLEKGNKATDWTPAPEDMATMTELNAVAGEIEAKVSNASTGDGCSWTMKPDGFSVIAVGSDKEGGITVDQNGLTVTGTVCAPSGKIGGLEIQSNLLCVTDNIFGVYSGNIENDDYRSFTTDSLVNSGMESAARIYIGDYGVQYAEVTVTPSVSITGNVLTYNESYDCETNLSAKAVRDYAIKNIDAFKLVSSQSKRVTLVKTALQSGQFEYSYSITTSLSGYTISEVYVGNVNGHAFSGSRRISGNSVTVSDKWTTNSIYSSLTTQVPLEIYYEVHPKKYNTISKISNQTTIALSGELDIIQGSRISKISKITLQVAYASSSGEIDIQDRSFLVLNDGSTYLTAAQVRKSLSFGTGAINVDDDGPYLTGTWYDKSGGSIITSWRGAKSDIEPLSDEYSNMFDNLVPSRFKYRNGESRRYHIGFVLDEFKSAMDVAGLDSSEVAAYCISDETTGEGGIRYGELVALNTWQIQKLKKRVVELEEKNNLLEERLAKIESLLNAKQ